MLQDGEKGGGGGGEGDGEKRGGRGRRKKRKKKGVRREVLAARSCGQGVSEGESEAVHLLQQPQPPTPFSFPLPDQLSCSHRALIVKHPAKPLSSIQQSRSTALCASGNSDCSYRRDGSGAERVPLHRVSSFPFGLTFAVRGQGGAILETASVELLAGRRKAERVGPRRPVGEALAGGTRYSWCTFRHA